MNGFIFLERRQYKMENKNIKNKHYIDTCYKLGIVVTAIFIALFLGGILFLMAGANPFEAYAVMFTKPLGNKFGITEMLVRAAPLMFVGVGISVAFRSGILNIGGEGQIMMGAAAGIAFTLIFKDLPRSVLIPSAFIASFIGGALWAGIAGYMKAYLQVNEILSTVMLNYIAAQIYVFLIRGPLIDPKEIASGTGIAQTELLTKTAWLGKLIKGTRLHTGIIIAIVLSVLIYIMLWKTTLGYKLRAVGAEAKAANYAGMNVKLYLVMAIMISGGFCGMAGAVEALGVHHRGLEGLSAGYGFSGIVVALFGGLNPLGIIPASALFGLLILGADMMQRAVEVPSAIVLAIQGLIILAIVSTRIFLTDKKIKEKILKKIFFQKKDKIENNTKTDTLETEEV
jgi:simple sugar transport system permease protein